MRKTLMIVGGLMVVAVAVVWGAQVVKPSAQSKGGAAVAFAKADIATGTVRSFGGKGTTGVYVSETSSSDGAIELTFTGKYPSDLTTDQVIVTVTTEVGTTELNLHPSVARALVTSASSTQLVIFVHEWESDTLEAATAPVFLTVYLGQRVL